MKITIIGAGYVGLSMAAILMKKHQITIVETDTEKCRKLKNKICPINEPAIQTILSTCSYTVSSSYVPGDIAIIAVPTDQKGDSLDTSIIEKVITGISKNTLIVIKSTVPVGFTESLKQDNVIFSPEFLRESYAFYDNLFPTRIIAGITSEKIRDKAEKFVGILKDAAKNDPPTMLCRSSEAEAIKIFSNTYLALRIAFFNEIDSFAENADLDTKAIISGMCLDSRIGDFYNNPSFGFGGYCLPKDTKQADTTMGITPHPVIHAIGLSNEKRKQFVADQINKLPGKNVGVYRLIMKKGSDNFRKNAVQDVIKRLPEKNILLYEPQLKEEIPGITSIKDLNEWKDRSDIILANRMEKEIEDVREKVYTRDLFGRG